MIKASDNANLVINIENKRSGMWTEAKVESIAKAPL